VNARAAGREGVTMQSNNPVFRRSPAFAGRPTVDPAMATPEQLERMYAAPTATPAQTGRMTLDDVVMKTGVLFAVLLVTSALSWFVLTPAVPALPIVAAIAGFVLAMVISFKQSTSPALIVTYAAIEGVFVGGVSLFYSSYAGTTNIVGQAVLGTLAAFVGMLVVYRSGRLRATPKFTRMLLIAAVGYLVVSLASLVAGAFGVGDGWGFRTGGLGLLLCVAGVVIASLFLILDFDFIERAVAQGAPQRTAWLAGFGLMVTLVWIYLEILRFLAILRR
jgi:uncharacterized YccA/Bax inhibitor family protein